MSLSAHAQSAYTPITLGGLSLRNRFIKSATNEGMAKGGVPSKALVELHRQVAAGGAGMTTVAYCAVSADGRTFEDQATLDAASVRHFRVLTAAVHAEGAAASAQITHGGAFNFLPRLSTKYPLSASTAFNAPGVLTGRLLRKGMTPDDLETVAQQFVDSARHARESGFDAVELHMGHGYLLSQFISPAYNKRRDAFGGSAEKRAHFPAMVLRRVLDAVGRDMAVLCKISVTEGFRKGATVDDAIAVAGVLEREGAHLLVLSGGMNVESPWTIFGSSMPAAAVDVIDNPLVKTATRLMRLTAPKIEFRELYFMNESRRVRAAVKMPLAYLGGVTSLAGIETVMREGFDGVAMGRALLHDPELIARLARGEITRSGCTACNQCVVTMYSKAGTHCVLQAPAGNEALNAQAAAAAR